MVQEAVDSKDQAVDLAPVDQAMEDRVEDSALVDLKVEDQVVAMDPTQDLAQVDQDLEDLEEDSALVD